MGELVASLFVSIDSMGGGAKPLFKDITDRHDLRVTKTKHHGNGVVMLKLQSKEQVVP